MHLGGPCPGFRQVQHHAQKRFDALAQIASLRRPVVHFGVDVDGVLAAPGRVHAIGPEALQIGRLPARARAGEQQVPAKLKVEGRQLRIGSLPKVPDAFVGRQFHGLSRAQVQGDFAKEPLMFRNVGLAQRGEGFLTRGLEVILGQETRIAADVFETLVTGRGRDHQYGGIRVRDRDLPGGGAGFSTGSHHSGPGLKLQRPLDAIGVAIDAAEHERVGSLVGAGGSLRGLEARGKRHLSRSVRADAYHDHLIHRTGEKFAGVFYARDRVTHACDGGIEIQVPAIISHRIGFGEIQEQITHRLVRHLAARLGDHLLVHEVVGLTILARKDQAASLRQGGQRFGVIRIVRAAAPKRIFIELQDFLADAPEDHRAQPAVADGQRFGPGFRGLPIPQTQRLRRCLGLPGEFRRGGTGTGRKKKRAQQGRDKKSNRIQGFHMPPSCPKRLGQGKAKMAGGAFHPNP